MMGLSKDDILMEDIEEALKAISSPLKDYDRYERYSPFLIWTVENLKGINDIVNYKGKDVYIDASSGDQYLACKYYGAKKVDIYDIDRFTMYMTYLKAVSLCHLSYEDFFAFLAPLENRRIKDTFWSPKILSKILPDMPSDVALFWDVVMNSINDNYYGNFIVVNSRVNLIENIKKGMPFYESEEEYYKLQNLLKNESLPDFYEKDIESEMHIDNDKKYNVIYLSNILEHLVACTMNASYPIRLNEDSVEEDLLISVMPSIVKQLKKDGIIQVSYRRNRSKDFCDDLLYDNFLFDVTEIESKMEYDDNHPHFAKDTDLVLTYQPDKRNTRNYFNK